MTDTATTTTKLNRRSLLMGAVFLVGGAVALTRFTRSDSSASAGARRLSADQYSVLEQVSEIIIPATDTPGAIAAGVPDFVGDMFEHWASAASRLEITGVLDGIDKLAWSRNGAGFLELGMDKRIVVVSAFDQEKVTSKDAAYRKFKRLVLTGYYHSDIGATQELRFELVPGAWRPCLPLSEVGRSSAV